MADMSRRRELTSGSPSLNWRRGFFRLWLLASVAWMLGWGIYSILSAIAHAFLTPQDLLARAVVFLGPPVALLLFGFAARWAIQGFVPRERGEILGERSGEKVVRLRENLPDDYVS